MENSVCRCRWAKELTVRPPPPSSRWPHPQAVENYMAVTRQLRVAQPPARRALQKGAGAGAVGDPVGRGGQAPAAHLLQLGPGGHLLGEQRGLDPLEQPLEP